MKRTFALLAIFLFVNVAHGQTAGGFPQYGSFQSFGLGSVNLQNLNFSYTIPIATSPGRGMNLNFGISYNSSLWSPSGTAWTPAVNDGGQPTWGWNLTSPVGSIPHTYSTGTCYYIQGEHVYPYTTYLYQNYEYIEPNGTVHSFPTKYVIVPSPCTGHGTYISGSQYATDGSGYFINISSPTAPVVYSPSGLKITSNSLTDTNGNSITETVVNSSETDWTDSSGRVALKIVSSGSSVQYEALTPSGTYDTTTLTLTSQNVKTNFGCSGITEYTGTASLPYEISFANGTTYNFAYETSGSNTVTGRLTYIAISGGSYHLTFSGGANDGINCSDGSGTYMLAAGGLVAAAGDWTFSRASSGANWQTTFTMPDDYNPVAQDQALYTFNSTGQEVSHRIYEGNISGGTLMRQVNTVWASNGSPQSTTTILEDGNTAVETDTTFDQYGNLATLVEHNWGTVSSAGPVLRTTNLSYIYSGSNGSTYLAANILNRVLSKTVSDQNNVVQYSESIGYDLPGNLNTPCITGALQHNDTSYGCSFTTRGLATSDTVYANAAAQSGGETKNFTFDSLGNLRAAQLDCCQQKQWNYSATTQYTFPDSIVRGSGPTTLTTSYTYNAYTGLVATSTDENGQQTTYTDDAYGRPLTITRPDKTVIAYGYNDANETSSVSVPISGSLARVQQTTTDGLGRPVVATLMDATGTKYSTAFTNYDNFNRVMLSSTPYNGGTEYDTKMQYDVLGRLTTLTAPDGAVTTYSYSTNTLTVTDPAGKSRKTAVDGLGRVVTVFEPDPTNNNLLTQQTSYTYTVLDALAGVSQGVQTRSYTHDGIGRITNSSTPEAGAVSYQYNSFDLVTQRTDARGVITSFYYDALNRLAGLSYTIPQGSSVSPMPNSCTTSTGQQANVCYFYDRGGASKYALGRLTEMIDPTGTETPTYDLLGRATAIQKVISGTTYPILYGYNLANEVTSITYPSGRVVQPAVDAIGRLASVADTMNGVNTTYASGFTYNPASQVTALSYGNGVAAAFTYSPDRLQLTGLSYQKTGQTLFGVNYWYKLDSTNCPTGTSSNNGQVQCVTDTVDSGRTVNYAYDPTARLASAVTNGSTGFPKWGLAWTYDRYGNRTAQSVTAGSAPSNSLVVNTATNQITTSGYQNDLSGNMTNDGQNTIIYDALNRETSSSGSLGSGTYSYDGHGLRVAKSSAGTTTVYVFSGSKVIAEYQNGAAPTAPTREYVYGGGALLANITSGVVGYFHADNLSERIFTDSSGNVIGQRGDYPYGESWYAQDGTTKWQFTTYERDSESSNDYAMARYYVNRVGRFSSTDPLSGSTADPQSLNHYSYVRNDPGNNVDPSGMMMINMTGYILGLSGGWDTFDDGSDEFDVLRIPLVTGTITEPYAAFGDWGPSPNSVGSDDFGTYQVSWAYGGPGVEDVTFTFFGAPILSWGYTVVGPPSSQTPPEPAKTSKVCKALSNANASGTLLGYPATQTFSIQTGLTTESTSGDISAGTPGLGVSMDTTINAPTDFGGPIPGTPAPQISFNLGKFISVGTFGTANGVQGIVYSLGFGLTTPITITIPIANPCATPKKAG